nr:MAG TPA: hypothetical protein [Caudoviricetes sp.]
MPPTLILSQFLIHRYDHEHLSRGRLSEQSECRFPPLLWCNTFHLSQ